MVAVFYFNPSFGLNLQNIHIVHINWFSCEVAIDLTSEYENDRFLYTCYNWKQSPTRYWGCWGLWFVSFNRSTIKVNWVHLGLPNLLCFIVHSPKYIKNIAENKIAKMTYVHKVVRIRCIVDILSCSLFSINVNFVKAIP